MDASQHSGFDEIRRVSIHYLDGDLINGPSDKHAEDCPGCKIDVALAGIEEQLEAARRKVDAYDRARALVKTEGNTRAEYVLRAEAAQEQFEVLQRHSDRGWALTEHQAREIDDCIAEIKGLREQLEAAQNEIINLTFANEGWPLVLEQFDAMRDELERIAIDPARALSLYERGIVSNPASRQEGLSLGDRAREIVREGYAVPEDDEIVALARDYLRLLGDVPGMQQLSCGCWQRWIEGSIITSEFSGWVTVFPCTEHKTEVSNQERQPE